MDAQLKQIRLFIFDIDGVLTDGRLHFSQDGECCKSFHAQDGLGINLLKNLGIEVALITGRNSQIVAHRAQNLGIEHLYQNQKDKTQAFAHLLAKLNLKATEAAYMGDDLIDLPLLTQVGWAIAPADANASILPFVHYQTQRKGGEGAVREAIDYWLKATGHMDLIVQNFLQSHTKALTQ